MKALAFHHPQMVGKNATVIDTTENGWTFEGRRILRLGIIGPRFIELDLVSLIDKRRQLESTLLTRMATYELNETSWAVLFSVEGLTGVFYLRRKPFWPSAQLTYQPLNDGKALALSLRSSTYRIYTGVHDANEALRQLCVNNKKAA